MLSKDDPSTNNSFQIQKMNFIFISVIVIPIGVLYELNRNFQREINAYLTPLASGAGGAAGGAAKTASPSPAVMLPQLPVGEKPQGARPVPAMRQFIGAAGGLSHGVRTGMQSCYDDLSLSPP
ncbi:hypothetical protein [Duganella radicis]|uniref:Uncharacterized protein n=1 Tax=Duganella radicis TaxID=551988 RepID=A0A6L6PEY6_9BURK|nr:hypothetical protein [Duganella radicis]MTV37610.1 hypothetical protein [Duganella radicis]